MGGLKKRRFLCATLLFASALAFAECPPQHAELRRVINLGKYDQARAVSGAASGSIRMIAGDQSATLLNEAGNGAIESFGTKMFGVFLKVGGKETIGQYALPNDNVSEFLDQVVNPITGYFATKEILGDGK